MPAMHPARIALIGAASLLLITVLLPPAAVAEAPGSTGKLQEVAHFDHQVTGVAVTESGRIFMNFPRWSEDVPVSVAELKNGALLPYPNAEWNKWRNAAPLSAGDHFVCVQSVFADGHGSLWVLDPAAPNTEHIVKGGPKLVQIDLATNSLKRVIPIDITAAPEGSYLNDFAAEPRWQDCLHHRLRRPRSACRPRFDERTCPAGSRWRSEHAA